MILEEIFFKKGSQSRNSYDLLFGKLNKNSKKFAILVKLIDDLKENLDESSEE